jgi:hypothetical protein
MPQELAQQLQKIGRVINPVATSALYKPRVVEYPPYVGVIVERDIKYGIDERNLLDIFKPVDQVAAKPVLLFVHSGGFVRGDRRTGPDSPFYDNIANEQFYKVPGSGLSGVLLLSGLYQITPEVYSIQTDDHMVSDSLLAFIHRHLN